MKMKFLLTLSAIACFGVVTAHAQTVEVWTCGGATFEAGYTANITVDDPYAGIWYQLEEDDDGVCEDFKGENLDFACNKKGNGNLVTSRIDDDTSPDMPMDYHQSNSGASLVISDSEVSGEPTYAMVHADVFIPGDCAEPFLCDHDGDAGSIDPPATEEITCYDSGYGIYPTTAPYVGGYFATAFDSCKDAFDNTSEGFWAELNEGGGMISDNRNPKKMANKNWAMYVELVAPDCDETLTVSTESVDYVETEDAPTCTAVALNFDGIVDGGDYFVDGGIDAGNVKFTPTTNCTATYYCDSLDGGETCEEDLD